MYTVQHSMNMIHWSPWMGDAPTWAAAVGAALAVIFTWRALQVERKRDRTTREAAERQQAELVAVWPEAVGLEGVVARITLSNRSLGPVYDTWVYAVLVDGDFEHVVEVDFIPIVPPNREVLVDLPDFIKDQLLARVRAEGSPGYWKRRWREAFPGDLLVGILFMDTGGREWKRDLDGRLVRLQDSSAQTWQSGGMHFGYRRHPQESDRRALEEQPEDAPRE